MDPFWLIWAGVTLNVFAWQFSNFLLSRLFSYTDSCFLKSVPTPLPPSLHLFPFSISVFHLFYIPTPSVLLSWWDASVLSLCFGSFIPFSAKLYFNLPVMVFSLVFSFCGHKVYIPHLQHFAVCCFYFAVAISLVSWYKHSVSIILVFILSL